MAKVTGPLNSMSASGALAKTIIFAHKGKQPYATKFHKPSGAKSAGQIDVRERFFEAKDAWNHLTSGEKLAYTLRAEGLALTGYNLFISEFELDAMKIKTIEVSAAQMLDLLANPIEVLPALPIGQMYGIVYDDVHFFPGLTPYQNGEALRLWYGEPSDGYGVQLIDAGTVLGTQEKRSCSNSFNDNFYGADDPGPFFGKRMTFGPYTTDFTDGDGTLKITVAYVILYSKSP